MYVCLPACLAAQLFSPRPYIQVHIHSHTHSTSATSTSTSSQRPLSPASLLCFSPWNSSSFSVASTLSSCGEERLLCRRYYERLPRARSRFSSYLWRKCLPLYIAHHRCCQLSVVVGVVVVEGLEGRQLGVRLVEDSCLAWVDLVVETLTRITTAATTASWSLTAIAIAIITSMQTVFLTITAIVVTTTVTARALALVMLDGSIRALLAGHCRRY